MSTHDDRLADVLERLTDVLEQLVSDRADESPAAHRDPKPDNQPKRRRVSARRPDLGPIPEHLVNRGRAALERGGYLPPRRGR